MIPNPLFPIPFAGGKDLWADVDTDSIPAHTRKMVERARLADAVKLADEVAKTAALTAQLARAAAIANEFEIQLDQRGAS